MRPWVSLRLRPAAIGAVSAALLIVSCGTDRIDLLPPIQAEGGSGHAGSISSLPSAGDGSDDPRGSGGALTNNGGGANSGGGGSGGGCVGEGCGGFTFGGAGHCDPEHEQCSGCWRDEQCPQGAYCSPLFGGVCVDCVANEHCDAGYACEQTSGECVVACEDSFGCRPDEVCDIRQGLCVECLDDPDCDGAERRRYCSWTQRCVECTEDEQCTEGSNRVCANGACAECSLDWHCGSDRHCNMARGYCED